MASLFEIGKTGVQAYRQALSVTGQNIANINTDGYNKRSADISEVAGVTGGPTNVSDSTGLGVRLIMFADLLTLILQIKREPLNLIMKC